MPPAKTDAGGVLLSPVMPLPDALLVLDGLELVAVAPIPPATPVREAALELTADEPAAVELA